MYRIVIVVAERHYQNTGNLVDPGAVLLNRCATVGKRSAGRAVNVVESVGLAKRSGHPAAAVAVAEHGGLRVPI